MSVITVPAGGLTPLRSTYHRPFCPDRNVLTHFYVHSNYRHRPQTSQSESICKSVGYFRHSLLVAEITGKGDQYKRTYYACKLALNGLRLTGMRLANQFIPQLIALWTKWLHVCEYYFLNDSNWNCLDSLYIAQRRYHLDPINTSEHWPRQLKCIRYQAISRANVAFHLPFGCH